MLLLRLFEGRGCAVNFEDVYEYIALISRHVHHNTLTTQSQTVTHPQITTRHHSSIPRPSLRHPRPHTLQPLASFAPPALPSPRIHEAKIVA